MKRLITFLIALSIPIALYMAYGWEYHKSSLVAGATLELDSAATMCSTYVPGPDGWDVSEWAVDYLTGGAYFDLSTNLDTGWAELQSSNDGGRTWTPMKTDACTTLVTGAANRPPLSWSADGYKHVRYWPGTEDATYYEADSTWFPYSHLRIFLVGKDNDGGTTADEDSKFYYSLFGIKE